MTLKSHLACAGLLLLFASPSHADRITNFVKNGHAIGGTGPAAYFNQGRPVQGSDKFSVEYQGMKEKFASAGHHDPFRVLAARYVPQYGGFCAFGAGKSFKVPVVPQAWKIVGGKRYRNNSRNVQKRFDTDTNDIIHGADLNWEIIKAKKPMVR